MQLVHPAPQFFLSITVKSNLTGCKVTFDIKILEKSPASGALPRPHCTLHIPFLKIIYCIKLYFEFDCLDCFSPIFASPTEKSFNFAPNQKIVPVHMETVQGEVEW